ncbi:MAG TPA: tetratricopeptide repeat protein [Tepidisphaeraceae bacterium]|jgi:tetratricopeptide (TPR) repeat protein|nr:tetratricopeptide repeat protein [Tepidisphaeraceae bacterium]
MTDRLQKLLDMLQKQPTDPFILYGIALEHKKSADFPQALDFLTRTLAADPGYCYAYFQQGQILEESGQPDQAKSAYQQGIAAATKKGDAHAKSELEGALMMLD